jgi:hypothetical protein
MLRRRPWRPRWSKKLVLFLITGALHSIHVPPLFACFAVSIRRDIRNNNRLRCLSSSVWVNCVI